MVSNGAGVVRGRGLVVVLVVMLVASLMVLVGSVGSPVRAGGVDPRVPGPSNPVGPTDWGVLVDEPGL
jgi:hypothetical protein